MLPIVNVMTIANLNEKHWPAVKRIYEEGIATGHATFQTSAPAWTEWNKSHVSNSRIVMLEGGEVIGWGALTPVSDRCVYAGVAEVSIYVASDARGKGVGKALLNELIKSSEEHGYWTLQAGIFPENEASLIMHEKAGFRKIGIRERIGKMSGKWRDTLLLERRSQKAGIE
jgi:phosphinothricin acetyltransferase